MTLRLEGHRFELLESKVGLLRELSVKALELIPITLKIKPMALLL